MHHRRHERHSHKGAHFFATVKVGERGQIVIPKEARDELDINPGDTLLVVGHKGRGGLVIDKADSIHGFAAQILARMGFIDQFSKEQETASTEEES